MARAWMCVKIGSAACRKIIHVAPWMLGAYLAAHPLPTACHTHTCHWVIPKREFLRGGIFAPTGPASAAARWQPASAAFSLVMLDLPTAGAAPARAATPSSLLPGVVSVTTRSRRGGQVRIPSPSPPRNVPEPPAAGLLAVGALAILLASRRPRRARGWPVTHGKGEVSGRANAAC